MRTDGQRMRVLVCLPEGLFGDVLASALQAAPADVVRVIEPIAGHFDVTISLTALPDTVVAPRHIVLPNGEAGPAVVTDLTGTTEVDRVIDLVALCVADDR